MVPKRSNVADVQELPDDLELTQYGEEGSQFRNSLRVDKGEAEMSLILGRQPSMAAALLITKTVCPWAITRYTTAGKLREQGFTVGHSPTRGNPLHVSVFAPVGVHGPVEWDEDMAKRFDQCFVASEEGGNRE